MAKGMVSVARPSMGANGVYSTKILDEMKEFLAVMATAVKPTGYGQRQLLDDMAVAFLAANKSAAENAVKLMDMYGGMGAHVRGLYEKAGLLEPETTAPPQIEVVQYEGRPQWHIYDKEGKHGTACALAGAIDENTIKTGTPADVDCKRCRNCRKALFE